MENQQQDIPEEMTPQELQQEIVHIPRLVTKFAWTMFGSLFVFVALVAALHWKYSAWMWTPNEHYIKLTFDGLKNYNTFSYDVAHDSSYVRYEGMNYPFGEHELFTDNQPLLSNICQFWTKNVSNLSAWTIGIMNLFQLFSAIFGALMLFWLLRRLDLPVWYAVLASVGINLLSPQYWRFDGHFGLSHSWVIPMLLILLSWYEEKNSRRYFSIWIGIFVTLVGMLHFYNFGMAALFLCCYVGFSMGGNFTGKNLFARFNHLMMMVIVPFFILNVWLSWDAYATDRPSTPFGFLTYIGQWEAVFLPYENFWLYDWINTTISPIRPLNTGESRSYIGIVASLFSLYLVFSGFYFFRKKETLVRLHRVDHAIFLKRILASSIVILLFACGFPFCIKGMEWMVDCFGPIRQFRGLGRFSWAFYYVINVVAFFGLYHLGRSRKQLGLKVAIWLLPLFILGYEAYFFQKNLVVDPLPNWHKTEHFKAEYGKNAWIDKVDYKQFQAILPLPYYHVGSENIWIEPSYEHFKKVQLTAFYTGLPDMGVMLSRTSVGQMTKSIQLMYPPCQIPEILSWFPNRKPLAVCFETKSKAEVEYQYPHLLRHAVPVYSNAEITFLSLHPDSIRMAVLDERKKIEKIESSLRLFPMENGFYSSKNYKDYFYKNFDSDTSFVRFRGKGALKANLTDSVSLFSVPLPKGLYYLSFWTCIERDNGAAPITHVKEYSAENGVLVQEKTEISSKYIKTVVNGWAMFEIPFTVQGEKNTVELFLKNKEGNVPFFLDEVLLRPSATQLFQKDKNWLCFNGFWFE